MEQTVGTDDFAAQPEEPARRARESLGRQALMKTLGAEMVHVGLGEVDRGLRHSEELCQQNGYLHAGAPASIADSVNGYAAFTLSPAHSDVLTVEFKINLLAPASDARFLATGRVLRPGRTLSVCLAEVYGLAEGGRRLIATMLSTVIVRPGHNGTKEAT